MESVIVPKYENRGQIYQMLRSERLTELKRCEGELLTLLHGRFDNVEKFEGSIGGNNKRIKLASAINAERSPSLEGFKALPVGNFIIDRRPVDVSLFQGGDFQIPNSPANSRSSAEYLALGEGIASARRPVRYLVQKINPNGHTSKHYHAEGITESIGCLAGKAEILLDGRSYRLDPGSVYTFYSGNVHQIKTWGSSFLSVLSIFPPNKKRGEGTFYIEE